MECAKAEFLKKGFQAAQLKDIVAAAKVTTGAVYRHFKDKEALFFALIEDVYHYTLDFLDNVESLIMLRIILLLIVFLLLVKSFVYMIDIKILLMPIFIYIMLLKKYFQILI